METVAMSNNTKYVRLYEHVWKILWNLLWIWIFSFHQNQHFSGYSIYDKYFRGWNKKI